jgi:hypothetical protein
MWWGDRITMTPGWEAASAMLADATRREDSSDYVRTGEVT